MDIELVRTFLEVNRLRHFARSAEQLFVTPAAVSARVRMLEEQLGAPLFVRSRNKVELTAAGQRFLPHAENMIRSWNRARLSVGTGGEQRETVAVGSLHSIWGVLLQGWVPQVYAAHRNLVMQLDLLTSQLVVARVREQSLDLGLLYEPPRASDLWVESVTTMELRLIGDRPGLSAPDLKEGYVHVDWGMQYAMTLARELPDLPEPVLRADAPEVAYEFLCSRGGAAYLPWPAVAADVEAGRLFAVREAPSIERAVCVIQSADARASAARTAVYQDLLAWLAERARTSSPSVAG